MDHSWQDRNGYGKAMRQGTGRDRDVLFLERCGWTLWLWFILIFMALSLSLAVLAALGNDWGVVSLLLQLAALVGLSQKSRLRVSVDSQWLIVGATKIERRFISSVSTLDKVGMQRKLGPHADPAAYLATRFWIHTGVIIGISDPQDSTPYWIVSSKKAQLLADALSPQT